MENIPTEESLKKFLVCRWPYWAERFGISVDRLAYTPAFEHIWYEVCEELGVKCNTAVVSEMLCSCEKDEVPRKVVFDLLINLRKQGKAPVGKKLVDLKKLEPQKEKRYGIWG